MTLHSTTKCEVRQFAHPYIFYMSLHLGNKWNKEKLLANEHSCDTTVNF